MCYSGECLFEVSGGSCAGDCMVGDHARFGEEFWLRLVTDEDGALSKEKVLAELHDYSVLLDIVPKVYDEVTEGHASKPFTVPEVVCWLVEDRIERRVDEALEEQRRGLQGD